MIDAVYTLVCLLPHRLTIRIPAGELTYETSGYAYVGRTTHPVDRTVDPEGGPLPLRTVEITEHRYGTTMGLPPPSPGVAYVVNEDVVLANPERTDLLYPDLGADHVRHPNGRLEVCRLLRLPRSST